MWRLALARQQLVLVAVAMVLLDASALSAAIGALGQADTFSDYSRAIYDESRTLADALGRASGGNLACAAAVLLYVAARPWPLAWLRASYIRGLCGKGGLPRPTWTSVVRLVLLDVLVGTPLTFAIGGLEKADLASLGAPLLLLVLVFTLYADYAIVVDELTLRQALRSSLHVLRAAAVWLARGHRRVARALVHPRLRARADVRQRRHAARPDRAARAHRRARLCAGRVPAHALPGDASATAPGRRLRRRPGPSHFTTSVWPTCSADGSMLGLSRRSSLTLVPNWVAIENSVSPGLTVHLTR